MRRIAALSTFLLLAGHSTLALADIQPDRPATSAETPEPTKSAEPTKTAETPTKSDEKKNGCSASDEDNGMLALAALALLLSGVALRRRGRSDVQSASA
jgi:uncharacterized protein (TIGR03382 family)